MTDLQVLVVELATAFTAPDARISRDLPGRRTRDIMFPDLDAGASLYARIKALTEPGVERTSDGSTSTKVSGSPAPVRGWAFNWWTDVHAGAREHEAGLRILLDGTACHRPGADEDTVQALLALPALVYRAREHFPVSELPNRVEKDVTAWHTRALALLGVLRPWALLPGVPCGTCGNCSLRVRPDDYALVCSIPGCGFEHETAYIVGSYLRGIEETA